MTRRLKRLVFVLVILFAIAQFVRPGRANPPTDPSRTITHLTGANALGAVLDRGCRDCHTNQTVWPWYTQVAPVSWLMAYAVAEGRKAVNYSDWATYSPSQQRALLSASCQDVSTGKMPGIYTVIRPETRLSSQDIETICAAAKRTDATK